MSVANLTSSKKYPYGALKNPYGVPISEPACWNPQKASTQ